MRQRIQNTIYISVEGVDLTTLSNIEIYVEQKHADDIFLQYTPVVVDANTMYFVMPKADADRLGTLPVKLQFAFTYEDGSPDASDTLELTVKELIKEGGYNAG